jgi:hypothetical protein
MCEGCYHEYGSPRIITEATKHAASLIDAVYGLAGAGGHAHVVIDDWNLEDHYILDCLEWVALNDQRASPEQLKAERDCLEALSMLSVNERASAMAIHAGYLTTSLSNDSIVT